MSRLSGIIARKDGEEVFSITWKNYLELDSVIWGQAFDNHAVEDKSLDDDNTTLIFNSAADFETVMIALDMRIKQGFTGDEIMSHTIEEAEYDWDNILYKIWSFFEGHPDDWYDDVEFEFFSCV